jgi:hypothetical protein
MAGDSNPTSYTGRIRRHREVIVPFKRMVAETLEKWRKVDLAMSELQLQPEAFEELRVEPDRLREEYQGLIPQAVNEHRPEPRLTGTVQARPRKAVPLAAA